VPDSSYDNDAEAILWSRVLRPLLFRLDPERAHQLAIRALALAQPWLARRAPFSSAALRRSLWGLDFPNPVGLAAGFDKDARAPLAWSGLGFGFAELGTVTTVEQLGNPKPRIFRLPAERALINRLGFNNEGAAAVAARLARTATARRAPLGINLGKSRVTAIEDAVADYVTSFRQLAPLADYVVVNVSSPNTPGLRDLQTQAHLSELLSALQTENGQLARRRPLLVKLAPDLADADLVAAAASIEQQRCDGIIATNTTIRRDLVREGVQEAGGLSGAPLRDLATQTIRRLYQLTAGRLPIIGVGGIFNAGDAYEKIRAGASLVQVYTGFIYQGPLFPRALCRALESLLARDGYANIAEAVGTAV
jgi:dihydroorotate dehydrogenase